MNETAHAPGTGRETGGNGWIDGVIRAVDGVAIAAAWLAMLCLVALTLLILAQVAVAFTSRLVPSVRGDIPIVWEYSAYLMGATFMLGSGLTLRAGAHIRLGIVLRGASTRLRTALELLSSSIGLAFLLFLTWTLGRAAWQSFLTGTISTSSATPLWIPLSTFAAGSFILALQLATRVLACLTGRPVENLALRPQSIGE